MAISKIEWTDETLNPIGLVGGGHGCAKVSPGCDNCYAELISKRFWNTPIFDGRKRKYELRHHIFNQLLKWRKPRMVFVCSMMDLFHHDVPEHFIKLIFDTIQITEKHTYQVLTKRPERFRNTLINIGHYYPIETLWLGVTAENQKFADKRIPLLLQTPAAKRFVSLEPLLGEIDLGEFKDPYCCDGMECTCEGQPLFGSSLDWVIIGCETGRNRRPCNLEWVYKIVEQCVLYNIPVFIKQLEIDGKVVKDINQFTTDLQIRQFPVEGNR